MQSFREFLSENNRIEEHLRQSYQMWVARYCNHAHTTAIGDQSMASFLQWLSGKYARDQVQSAKRALQMYCYYRTRYPPRTSLQNAGAGQTEQQRADVARPGGVWNLQGRPQLFFVGWDSIRETLVKFMRLKHLSPRTEKAYLAWIGQFQAFLKEKPCRKITEQDLKDFLSYLAVERKVAAATQRLAFNAILFLFRNALGIDANGLSTVVASHVPKRLPVVLTREEIQRIFSHLRKPYLLMVQLIYGGGLRLEECLSLRVKDIDFERGALSYGEEKATRIGKRYFPKRSSMKSTDIS